MAVRVANSRLVECIGMVGRNQKSERSFLLVQRSAMQGFAAAQARTATCYKDGTGVVKNEFETLAWFNLATQNDEHAIRQRATLENRLGYNQSTAAQQRSRELEKQIRKEPRKKSTQPANNDKQGSDKEIKATGREVFITDDGYIITAAHVVSDATCKDRNETNHQGSRGDEGR